MTRNGEAGVTMIEMLVVLTLFAVVAGAVVLSVPGQNAPARQELSTLSLSTRLDAVVDRAMRGGGGFGLWKGEGQVLVLDPAGDGKWRLPDDPRLNPVKLFDLWSRISDQLDDGRVYAVSPALVPERGTTLTIALGQGTERARLSFDGLRLSGP